MPPPISTTDVIIVGAGPVGLALANHLGLSGLQVLVLEKLDSIIDYPRAIGIDDESLRLLQSLLIINHVLPHTTPNHGMKFLTSRGRCFADIQPTTSDFGWPRRNAFTQPDVDQVLLNGLNRCPTVDVLFSQNVLSVDQDAKGVTVVTDQQKFRANYLVGSDGGSSFVRKYLKIPFEGTTSPDKWIVVDISNDPLGTPNLYVCCDPHRAYVSAALPHSIRRLEFRLMHHETEEQLSEMKNIRALLAKVVPHPENIEIIRSRVYTHNARLAAQFRSGRILLAGDSAHIMPVWQGQGYNSGLRDVFNLGWKLARVARGILDPAVLDTYEKERRSHAKAMIDVSVMTGHIFNPPYRWMSWLRDILTWFFTYLPSIRQYLLEMRFKPMPRYSEGAALVTDRNSRSPVGIMFIQPTVFGDDKSGKEYRLDDIIGPDNFAFLSWGTDPTWGLSSRQIADWKRLGTTFIQVLPVRQLSNPQTEAQKKHGVVRVGDGKDGLLKKWFGSHTHSIIILRPDRFIGCLAIPQTAAEVSEEYFRVLGFKA